MSGSNLSASDDFSLEGESFYDTLEIDQMATKEEIKRSYQRLVRRLHPDKRTEPAHTDTCGDRGLRQDCDDKFLALQRAWTVLKDPDRRRRYDAALACRDHADLLLYETLNLTDLQYDQEEQMYKYPCRCGGYYAVSENDSTQCEFIVGCDECSFSILVKNLKIL